MSKLIFTYSLYLKTYNICFYCMRVDKYIEVSCCSKICNETAHILTIINRKKMCRYTLCLFDLYDIYLLWKKRWCSKKSHRDKIFCCLTILNIWRGQYSENFISYPFLLSWRKSMQRPGPWWIYTRGTRV